MCAAILYRAGTPPVPFRFGLPPANAFQGLRSFLISTLLLSVFSYQSASFAQGNLTPPGAPAPTMKSLDQIEPRTPISSLPFTIANAGSYYLTTNLVASSGAIGITINSDNVTVDLNGFMLDGNSVGNAGIATGAAHLNVAVRNGNVRRWTSHGVDIAFAANSSAENLLVSSNGGSGILVGENSLVKNCRAIGNTAGGGLSGIGTGAGGNIIDCAAEKNNGTNVFGIAAGSSSSVINCTANQNTGANGGGINVNVSSSMVNCSAAFNSGANGVGIKLGNDTSAIHCNASDNFGSGGAGIEAAARCTVMECKAVNDSGDGIRATNDCLISFNSASLNGGAGIHTAGQANRIDSNHVSSNTGNGIKVDSTGTIVVRNTARANGGGNYSIAASNSDAQQIAPGTGFATSNAWANFSF